MLGCSISLIMVYAANYKKLEHSRPSVTCKCGLRHKKKKACSDKGSQELF